jgi:hypothetical protein
MMTVTVQPMKDLVRARAGPEIVWSRLITVQLAYLRPVCREHLEQRFAAAVMKTVTVQPMKVLVRQPAELERVK